MFTEIVDYRKLLQTGKVSPDDRLNGILICDGARLGMRSVHVSLLLFGHEIGVTFSYRRFKSENGQGKGAGRLH